MVRLNLLVCSRAANSITIKIIHTDAHNFSLDYDDPLVTTSSPPRQTSLDAQCIKLMLCDVCGSYDTGLTAHKTQVSRHELWLSRMARPPPPADSMASISFKVTAKVLSDCIGKFDSACVPVRCCG